MFNYEKDDHIHEIGFYDRDGVWFILWERNKPNPPRTYVLANGTGPIIARWHLPNGHDGEMLLKEYQRRGI